MDSLEDRRQHLLHDFEVFESGFLPAYDPQPVTNDVKMENMSWIEELEKDFVDTQLCIKNFELVDRTLKPSNISLPIIQDISDPLALPPLEDQELGDDELPNQTNDTNDHKLLPRNANRNPANVENNSYDLMNVDEFSSFDLTGFLLMDFDTSTNSHSETDRTIEVNEAYVEYARDEFAKKVEQNMRVLQEAMQMKQQRCCIEEERAVAGVCCKGKCWRYMQSLLSTVPNIPKGRKRKGFKLSPEQIAIAKERQKIRNRISAAAAYKKEKDYLKYLEVQVEELKAENKIRRNFMKFLESASQGEQHENQSLTRTISGPL